MPGLLAEMARDPKGWKDVPSVVLIRIGINSLGKREDLQAFAKTGADADNLARVQACADQVAQAVSALKARDPALDIILVGILNNVDWPPLHASFRNAQELTNIAAVLDAYDQRLRQIAESTKGVHFFDDRAFFRHWFGARETDGQPAYKHVKLFGKREVGVTQGDEPWNAVIGDGHAGTVWNGLWAAAMVDEFNRIKGLDIPPIRPVEIAHAADPDGRFGLSE